MKVLQGHKYCFRAKVLVPGDKFCPGMINSQRDPDVIYLPRGNSRHVLKNSPRMHILPQPRQFNVGCHVMEPDPGITVKHEFYVS